MHFLLQFSGLFFYFIHEGDENARIEKYRRSKCKGGNADLEIADKIFKTATLFHRHMYVC